MSQKTYIQIQKLISSLSSSEILLSERYTRKYHSKIPDKRMDILIRNILFRDINKFNYDEFVKHLGIVNEKALEKKLNRLQHQIFDAITTELNRGRQGKLISRQRRDRIDVKKLHQKIMIAAGKGLGSITKQYLSQLITKSKRNEFYADLVEALYMKLDTIFLREKGKKFDLILEEIAHFEECLAAERKSHLLLMKWMQQITFSQAKKEEGFILSAIRTTKSLAKKTKSKRVLFIAFQLQMEYQQHAGNYNKSNYYCRKMLVLMQEHPFLHKKRNEGGVLMNMAHNSLWAGKLKECEQQLQMATDFFVANSFNTLILKEVSFKLAFLQGNIRLAKEVATQMCAAKRVQKNAFLHSKWSYHLACCYFLQGEYTHCLLSLNDCKELQSDKIGWQLSIEVLKIASLIERKLWDVASDEINYLQRLHNNQRLKARDKTALRVLQSMQEEGFSFKKVYPMHKSSLSKLSSTKGWYQQETQTPELFLFDEWFMSKLEGRAYQPNYKQLLK